MAFTPVPPVGQDDMAGSLPVVIASDQSAVPVSVSGVSTAANQTTIIGHVDGIETVLGTIDADTGAIKTATEAIQAGQLPDGHSVALSATDNAVLDAIAASVAAIDTDTTTIIGHVDGIEGLLTTIDADTGGIATSTASIDTKTPALGQALAAASVPVVLTAAQLTTLTPPAAIAGFATSANQTTIIGHLDGVETLLTAIDGHVDGIEGSVDGLETSNSAIQTAVELIDDTVSTLGTTTYTEATTKGITVGAVRRDADTTLVNTTNEIGPLQMDANGRLKVEAFSGETLPVSFTGSGDVATQTTLASLLTSSQLIDDAIFVDDTATHSTGSTKGVGMMAVATPTDTAVNANDIGMIGMTNNREQYVSLRDISGAAAVSGSGTATGALRVELPTNGTGVIATVTTVSTVSALGTGTTGPQKAEDVASAGGDMGVAIMVSRLDTPVANAGVSNDGDYTTPILDNFRKVWVTGTVPEDTAHVAGEAIVQCGVRRIDTPATSAGSSADWATMDASAEGAIWATLTPTTTGGCSIFRSLDLDETEEEIKATAGNIYGYYYFNATASVRYLKFYNATAANVTVGSTTPVLTFGIPASAAGHVAFPYPIGFGTAISAAVTTGVADADTGAPGTNDIILNVLFK